MLLALAVAAGVRFLRRRVEVSNAGAPAEISTPGRHDPCLVPRMVPVVEAMTAIVLADLLLLAKNSRLG